MHKNIVPNKFMVLDFKECETQLSEGELTTLLELTNKVNSKSPKGEYLVLTPLDPEYQHSKSVYEKRVNERGITSVLSNSTGKYHSSFLILLGMSVEFNTDTLQYSNATNWLELLSLTYDGLYSNEGMDHYQEWVLKNNSIDSVTSLLENCEVTNSLFEKTELLGIKINSLDNESRYSASYHGDIREISTSCAMIQNVKNVKWPN